MAAFLCVVLVSTVLTGCENIPKDTRIVLTTGLSDDQVFRIDTQICTKSEVLVYLTNLKNKYQKVYGEKLWETKIPDGTLESQLKNSVLQELEQIKMMNLMSGQLNVTLTSQEEKQIQSAAGEYYGSLNAKEIAALGVTEKEIAQMYREYEIANKVYDAIIQDVNPEISDDEARIITVQQIGIKTYSTNSDGERVEFTDDQKAAAKEKASQARQKALSGEDFNTLIGQYSDASESKVSFGKGEKESAYETAAFNLANDEISDIIETKDGYYILKCISTFDKEETASNKEKILAKRKSDAFHKEYDTFAKSVTKELNQKLWNSIGFISDQDVTSSTFFSVFDDTIS